MSLPLNVTWRALSVWKSEMRTPWLAFVWDLGINVQFISQLQPLGHAYHPFLARAFPWQYVI